MIKDAFAALHTGADPLVLFNIWDAGSAKIVAEAGATAIATGSLSLAGAQGFEDGEQIPFDVLLAIAERIAGAVRLPLSVDIESGYADNPESLSANAQALHQAGAVGCNLEDQLIGSEALREPAEQAERIAAVDEVGLFVNARTDLFLRHLMRGDDPNQDELVESAIERASLYREAGAGCLFVPGLSDPDLIARLCRAVDLPVNVMRLPGMISNADLGNLGVARISYGPGPWRDAMRGLADAAHDALSS
ncbi:isocitrate lyase/PEP mutase family protein [Altererythrobacter lutimaris]|uniref:Isocitrate lyase/phosphoenolpyruvate mutase family protein n=1 Tax=Altererythrobacter lutimaris TaxID=2743979 RepID=A0A850H8Q2_9SPHN|nr:isocitrate lyase/phosphoenolpyruvate mutase family protein [Altererythrobacter lutimaris]NVE93605.1 isocitrate lyase/phosphoenolpyruvate mutase family protein [Altererythrobacter lutimaris]